MYYVCTCTVTVFNHTYAHTRFQHKICVIVLFSVSEAKNRDVITKPPAIKLKVSQSTPMETNC